jgi:hypothetical protein
VPTQWYLTTVLFPDYMGPDNPLSGATRGSYIAFNYQTNRYINGLDAPYTTSHQMSQYDISHVANLESKANILTEIITPNEIAKVTYVYDRTDAVFNTFWTDGAGLYKYCCHLAPRMSSIQLYACDKTTVLSTITFQTENYLRPASFNSTSFIYMIPYPGGGARDSADCFYINRTGGDVDWACTNTYPVRANPTEASLTLTSVTIEDGKGNRLPPVYFDYDATKNDTLQHVVLRCKHGSSVVSERPEYTVDERDVWGYFKRYRSPADENDFNPEGSYAKAHREDGTPYADAWSLRSVIMPTGQRIRWEYESNRYDMANNVALPSVQYGGGIRVKKVIVSDGKGRQETTSYFYADANDNFSETDTNSSGHATVLPYNYISDIDSRPELTRGGMYTPCKVAYEKVKVVKGFNELTRATPFGYTVYNFVTSKNVPNLGGYGEFDKSNLRGVLDSTMIFDSAKTCISSQHSEYSCKMSGNQLNATSLMYESGVMYATKTTSIANGVTKVSEYKYAPEIPIEGDIARTREMETFATLPIGPLPHEEFIPRFDAFNLGIHTNRFDSTEAVVLVTLAGDYFADEHNNRSWHVVFTLIKNPIWNTTRARNTVYKENLLVEYSFPDTTHFTFSAAIGTFPLDINGPSFLFTINRAGYTDRNVIYDVHIDSTNTLKYRVDINGQWGSFTPDAAVYPGYVIGSEYYDNELYVQYRVLEWRDYCAFDLDGRPNQTIEIGNGGKKKITAIKPAFIQYPAMLAGNQRALNYQTIVYDSLVDANHVVAAQTTTWADSSADSSHVWLPQESYAWKSDLNANGLPVRAYDSTLGADWKYMGKVSRYDSMNRPRENESPLGGDKNIYSTVIYGHNGLLPIGAVKNARLNQCGIFTGDYDMNVVVDGVPYFDYPNGWEKSFATLTGGVSGDTTKHFGERCVRMVDNYGPVRISRIDTTRDYVAGAWVKVTGRLLIVAQYCNYTGNSEDLPIPPGSINHLDYAQDRKLITGTGKWHYVELPIKARRKNHTGIAKPSIRLIFSNHPDDIGASGNSAYLDDVRFYPNNGQATSTYYNTLLQQPITTVGVDGNPSQRVAFDDFGRPVNWYTYDAQDHDVVHCTKKQEYHLQNELTPNEHIRVITPNEGGLISSSERLTIRWVNDSIRNIRVSLRRRDGSSWYSLPIIPLNSGSGSVTIPDLRSLGGKNLVAKVEDADRPAVISDTSDLPFRINNPPPQPTIADSLISDTASCWNMYKFFIGSLRESDDDTLSFNVYKNFGDEQTLWFSGTLLPGETFTKQDYLSCESGHGELCSYYVWVVTYDGIISSPPSSMDQVNVACP